MRLRRAFTMIELIFVIIVLGILAAAMKMNMPDNRILTDTNFITQKIKAKQIQALSYDNFDYQNSQFTDDKTCIIINKETINSIEKNSTSTNPYKISPKTIITHDDLPDDLNVCFDNLGRPYKLNNFAKMPIEFKITYKNRTKIINVMPYSGNVVIKK